MTNTLQGNNQNYKPFYIHVFEDAAEGSPQTWQAAAGIHLASCPTGRWRGERPETHALKAMEEQVDLINSLYLPDLHCTFCIRHIATPCPGSFSAGSIDISILCKVSAAHAEDASETVQQLAGQLLMLLGGTYPDHTWLPLASEGDFNRFWQPLDWNTAHISEVRRREEQVKLDIVQSGSRIGFKHEPGKSSSAEVGSIFYVHPFLPRAARFERMLRMMLLGSDRVVLSTMLTPTHLSKEEDTFLLQEISACEGYRPAGQSNFQRIHEQRAHMLSQGLLDAYMRLQDAPFEVHISLASPVEIPSALMEACGVAVSAPIGETADLPVSGSAFLNMGGYDVISPATRGEEEIARCNHHLLKHTPWGKTVSNQANQRLRYLMDGHEAASAFRFPVDTGSGLPGINTQSRRILPIPREAAHLLTSAEERLVLGTNNYLGMPQQVTLPESDRKTHMYVVGQTGTGKSTLLKTMILSDMKAGKGLAFIDPHGDLFEELLGMVPPERMDDVLVFDPADMDYPVGFNLLECSSPEERHAVVREMRAIMQRLLLDQYQRMASEYTGPIFYQHMQMNMLLAMSDPENPGTLLEFYNIYQSRNYWRRWLPLKWQDEQLLRWVKTMEYMDYTDRRNPQEASLGEYLSSKFMDFIFDPRLRGIFGQHRSTLNLEKAINSNQIILINLAKGLIGEANSNFLGLVLMAKFQTAAMARSHLPPSERKSFYLYVDEFQNLATENFTVLLSEARKFGMGLILANQFISQIKDERIIQALFGNVGSLLSFRLGHEDARIIETQFLPNFDLQDLTNLPNWQACLKSTSHGQMLPPFSLQTIIPNVKPDPEIASRVRDLSRWKYGRPRAEVDQEIAESLKEPGTEQSESLSKRIPF